MVNEDEAQRVREIFELYLEHGSLIPVVQELDRRGWRMKAWTTRKGAAQAAAVHQEHALQPAHQHHLHRQVEYGGQIYEGEHERIVDDETWTGVQERLNRNGRRGGRNFRNKYGALLKGLVRCATCDVGMIHTYTQKTPTSSIATTSA